MKKLALASMFVFILSAICFGMSFQDTLDYTKAALLNKNMEVLNKHVDFGGIVGGKVKNFAMRAAKKKSFMTSSAGKIAEFSEPAITAAASKFIMSEYSKSSLQLRKYYYDSLTITKVWDNGQTAFASGTFMGQKAIITALKRNGDWVIVSADSPLVDSEFKAMLKILHVL